MTIAGVGAEITIIDDEEAMAQIVAMALERDGHHCRAFTDAASALQSIDSAVDVVVTDLKMPEVGGLEVLHRVRALDDPPPVILITAHGTVDTAVSAMRDGAFDYITKPFDNDELRAVVGRAIELRRLRSENRNLREDVGRRYGPQAIIAESEPMRDLLDVLRRVAPSKATVLIQGESGTGKELAARLLHYWSDRVGHPFVAVNCKAFAEGVLESELFGHEAGAFTGATGSRAGCFERASDGTLFLDEIGEIGGDFQAKLLRVMQEGEVLRVGGNEPRPVKARVVAATNRDLRSEVESGSFREDLYFRLNVIPLEIPPLRERPADIVPLAQHFLANYCREERRQLELGEAALETLVAYPWPGNARELENVVERAVVLTAGDQIGAADLHLDTNETATRGTPDGTATLRQHLDRAAAEHIARALRETGGSRSEAAELLGIERTTLYRMMKKLGVD